MARRTRTLSLAIAVLALASGGCSSLAPTTSRPRTPRPTTTASPSTTAVAANRFQDTPLQGRTAVESAIELSEKYARLSDQTATLREDNQRLITENKNLQQQVETLEAMLAQTQKELGEANDLLIEMLTELNTWKSNVLGFRSEMRDAATAQLEAILKILEVLGGEAEAGALSQKHAATLDPEIYDAAPSNATQISTSGDPNESS